MTIVNHNQGSITARLRQVLAVHFDPDGGSPYWLDLARERQIKPLDEIRDLADLACLGAMNTEALAERPVEDFIPRTLRADRRGWIVAETGGTLGRSRYAVYGQAEFTAAFVTPFIKAAARYNFPHGENWLFVGPTGPHIIGLAASACAQAVGSPHPFMVDFDPRWARKLPPDSFARKRYLEHLTEQALTILASQVIGVIFATPPVLEDLAARVSAEQRLRVRALHFGGMPVTPALLTHLTAAFPSAVMMSGYGNTLLGVAPELHRTAEAQIAYYPHGSRLIYEVVDDAGEMVAYGMRGRIRAHRLDTMQLLVNVLERDNAIRIAPPGEAAQDGFVLDGLLDPQPIQNEQMQPVVGLY